MSIGAAAEGCLSVFHTRFGTMLAMTHEYHDFFTSAKFILSAFSDRTCEVSLLIILDA